jgi:hypothetical protein
MLAYPKYWQCTFLACLIFVNVAAAVPCIFNRVIAEQANTKEGCYDVDESPSLIAGALLFRSRDPPIDLIA